MDFVWILFAYGCGWLARRASLPPLLGYLAAGFIMHAMGFETFAGLDQLAELGITLMLFTIGLKVNVGDLLKREVLIGSVGHMSLWMVIIALFLSGIATLGLPFVSSLDWSQAALISFALSFSSTVCVVKLLEENGEMKTSHGGLAVGILILQDFIAVGFLVAATGKLPTIWALSLLIVPFIRPFFSRLLNDAGHAELLPLTGFFMALGAYEWFDLVGLKGDLGALLMGMLLSSHVKATELSKALLSFKDLFLIGFFLSIGFTALPDRSMLTIALVLSLLLPLKQLIFFILLTRLNIRARTSYLSSLILGNFSEFGLIVVAISVKKSWLPQEWLVILALSVAFSFIVTSVLYHSAHRIYAAKKAFFTRFERTPIAANSQIINQNPSEIVVIGLGRVGAGAFHALLESAPGRVTGYDSSLKRINQLTKEGLPVAYADGEDAELWDHIDHSNIKLILLALPGILDSCTVSKQLREAGYQGQIAAISRFEDEQEPLVNAGINKVFNLFEEAGSGFAEESLGLISIASPN